ncbi:unnamed protein product [marine sediment metagenome]|uniref:Uncharacterized protein n=1 Tax=marine sediment metagenome TaxID=412755 RepID=X1DN49_9ZZZZ
MWYGAAEFIQNVPYGCAFIKLDEADTALFQGVISTKYHLSK